MIKKIIEIYHERAQTRKALRLLAKQQWSVEFLTVMLVKAANTVKRPLEMTIYNHDTKIVINTIDAVTTKDEDSIFDHLDNETRVNAFIAEANRR